MTPLVNGLFFSTLLVWLLASGVCRYQNSARTITATELQRTRSL